MGTDDDDKDDWSDVCDDDDNVNDLSSKADVLNDWYSERPAVDEISIVVIDAKLGVKYIVDDDGNDDDDDGSLTTTDAAVATTAATDDDDDCVDCWGADCVDCWGADDDILTIDDKRERPEKALLSL